MKRTFAVVLLAAAILAGCSRGAAVPKYQPYIAGTITQIQSPRILVEEFPGEERGNKCWAATNAKTVYLLQEKNQVKQLENPNLQVGQPVSVWSEAPVLESYPCQGGADVILFR